jgi:hypothetical protein
MKNFLIPLMLLFLIPGSMLGQRTETIFDNSGAWISGIWLGPTYNYTQFGEDFAFVRGAVYGFELADIILVGWTTTRFKDWVSLEDTPVNFKMKYTNFFFSLTPASRKAIHPILSFQTGPGRLLIEGGDDDRVFIMQPSIGFEANVFEWCRLALEGGYRFVNEIEATTGLSEEDVSSLYGQISLKFGFSW